MKNPRDFLLPAVLDAASDVPACYGLAGYMCVDGEKASPSQIMGGRPCKIHRTGSPEKPVFGFSLQTA